MSTFSTLKDTNFKQIIRELSQRGISLKEQARRIKVSPASIQSYLYQDVTPNFYVGASLLELEENTRQVS